MFFFVSDTRRIADWSKLVKSKSAVKNDREERQMVTKSWKVCKIFSIHHSCNIAIRLDR
jgi:hypothetical protein